MNRENYQRVKEIFQAVLELAPDERRPHLDRVCTDDPELRGEVEKLLDAHDSGYLERPAVESFAGEIAGAGHAAGDMVGHYRIVEKSNLAAAAEQ